MTDSAPQPVPDAAREGANVEVVTAFWAALNRRDFAAVGAMMSANGHYVDVPVYDGEPGAFGPAETEARLRLGLEPLADYALHDGPIVASGDFVVTEHAETWTWEQGLSHTLRFTSVMEVRGAKVDRWWDYLDFGALMAVAPQWWLDHIASGYK